MAIALLLVTTFVIFGAVLIRSVRATLVDQVDEQVKQSASRSKSDKPGNYGSPYSQGENGGIGDEYDHNNGGFSTAAEDQYPESSGFGDYERPIARFVYSEDGVLLENEPCGYPEDPKSPPQIPPIPSPELEEILNEVVTAQAEDDSLEYRMLVQREYSGNVMVTAAPLDDVDDAVDRVIQIFLGFGAVTLLGAAGASWWFIRRELRPVDQMVDTATGIAAGDLTRRVADADTRTELGKLGAALNEMLTQIEESVEAQIASESRLRRFVSDASHELRNPLTSVRGYAELYRQGAIATPEAVDNAMNRIESEGGRMARLVDDMLMLARLDEDQALEMAPVDLSVIASEAVADFQVVAPDRPVDVQLAEPAMVTGDAQRLRQVVDNLLSNARIHTPAGTAVHVRLTQEGRDWVLTIADEGPGLSEAQQEHVFDRFWRADPARTRGRGGTGLGLAIVSSIAEAHNGSVAVRSVPGEGATFTIRIPARQQAG
jgi:two-component system OmpR family sensor kinase